MTKPYELEIFIRENGSIVQKITAKDSFNIDLFTDKGMLNINFKKWSEEEND